MKNLFYAALVRVTGPFEINVPSLFSMAGTIIMYPRPSVARNTSHSPCSSARLLVLCCKESIDIDQCMWLRKSSIGIYAPRLLPHFVLFLVIS